MERETLGYSASPGGPIVGRVDILGASTSRRELPSGSSANVEPQNENSVAPSSDGWRGSLLGHVLVAACACALTVAIAGSGAYLAYQFYRRQALNTQVRNVVSSLQNRTPEELAEQAARVKAKPKLARLVLPEVLASLRDSRSEQQQYSAIQILRAFLNHESVERALFELRQDGRETVAAAAVEALGELSPPAHAADVLGRCLGNVEKKTIVDAAVDEACAGLFRLGEVGREEMEKRLPSLSVERRVWLVGYVQTRGGMHHRSWLQMLLLDGDERVRGAAAKALDAMSTTAFNPFVAPVGGGSGPRIAIRGLERHVMSHQTVTVVGSFLAQSGHDAAG